MSGAGGPGEIRLRPVEGRDVAVFFEHLQDPEARRMAAFTPEDPHDPLSFAARWERIRSDPAMTARTVEVGGEVAGHVASFVRDGDLEVTYWLGRAFWGRGLATRALATFLEEVRDRPIHARAAEDNVGSRRVLLKCGFEVCGVERGFAAARGEEIREVVLVLRGQSGRPPESGILHPTADRHAEAPMSFPKPFYRFRPHPWHGLEVGPDPPAVVHAYIEITPFDLVKYEIDKVTGYLHVDRPQRTSSLPPTLYGIIPRTYCGARVGKLMPDAKHGDRDPLDVCVVSERPIARAEVILKARVVGGLPMVDGGEADDKIVAVLENDNLWGGVRDLDDLPSALVDRLRHYFTTYKVLPGEDKHVSIGEAYGHEHAHEVVRAAIEDYQEEYGD